MSTVRISQLCAALALFGAATPALADWTGKGDVGASFATGNSENQAASANLELKNKVDRWQHTFGFAGNYGSDGSGTTGSAGNCAASRITRSPSARTPSALAATRTIASAPTTTRPRSR